MLRAVVLVALGLSSLAPAVASAATVTVRAPESVRDGDRFVVRGKVKPVRRGLRAVIVDESGGGARPASPRVRVKPSGRYALRTFPYHEAFDPTLRVRVVRRNGSVHARSPAFSVRLVPVTKDTFRAVYAIPSDQPAQSAPGTNPPMAIAHEVGVANEWFQQQTGMRPRWRRDSSGRVEVATVRIAAPAEAFDGEHAVAFSRLRSEIDAKLDVGRNELLAVWIDARADQAPCGVYDTAPAQLVIWERACDMYPEADSTFPWGGATLLLTHEMTHAFGAAYVCAPHDNGMGHVTDDPRDILYGGTERYDVDNLMLDPGRDDYYMTGRADCPGIETSALWERNAAR